MRKRARTDSNHQQVLDWLRALQFSVKSTHQVGGGFVDICAGKYGVNLMIEVKDGDKVPSKRKLTPDEKKFHGEWRGVIDIVENFEDVVKLEKKAFRLSILINGQKIAGA